MKFILILVMFFFSACSVTQAGDIPSGEQGILVDYAAIEEQPGILRTELDTELSPYSLYGSVYGTIGPDNDIYLVNLDNGQATQISQDGLPKAEVVLTDKYVAWLVQQGEITVSQDGVSEQLLLYDIVVHDRTTGRQRQITQESAPRVQLAIDGERLVWADKRNEVEADYTMYDVYGYDLVADQEYAIAVAPGSQLSPNIHANYVVWQDNRNSPHKDTIRAGCGNCPDNRYDIYLYDFETGSTQAIAEDEWLKSNPVVYDHYVAWEGYSDEFGLGNSPGGTGDLYLFDLHTNSVRRLTQSEDPESSPLFSRDQLLWTVLSDCDVVNIQDGEEVLPAVGTYSLDLNTGSVHRLGNNKESFVLADQDTLLLIERCSREKVYMLHFDEQQEG